MAHEIDIQQLSELIESLTLVEVLPRKFFAEGHLPGAQNIPLEEFASTARSRLTDSDAPIVVYCASATCQNSHVAARQLSQLGYSNVRVFTGGKAAWRDAGLPLIAGEAA